MCKTKGERERVKRLEQVMSVQSESYKVTEMNKFLRDELNEIKGVVFNFHKGNIYVTKGKATSYPCIVAHTDTVHTIIDDFQVKTLNNDIMYAMDGKTGLQTGIGGDDKVGIYVALEMLRNHDIMKCAFFRDEEVGCVGSSVSNKRFFENVEFVFQCDRQKYEDFVRKISGKWLHDDVFADKIAPILAKYGKKEDLLGGTTDVGQLHTRGVKVCMSNISCGYYRPHRDIEIISIPEVLDTTDFVNELVLTLAGKIWINSDYDRTVTKVGNKNYKWGGNSRHYGRGNNTVWCYTKNAWVKPEDKIKEKWEDDDYVWDIHLMKHVRKDWLDTVTWNGNSYIRKDINQDTGEGIYLCPNNQCYQSELLYIAFTQQYYCSDCDKYYTQKKKV